MLADAISTGSRLDAMAKTKLSVPHSLASKAANSQYVTSCGSSIPKVYSQFFGYQRQSYDVSTALVTLSIVIAVVLRTLQEANCTPNHGTPCGQDTVVSSFPHTSSTFLQAMWVIKRLLWLPWYLGLFHGLQAYAVFILMNWIVVLAAWRQPRWYLQGGRSALLACIRSINSLDGALTLALGVDRGPIHKAFHLLCHGGQGNTVRMLMWMSLTCQLPMSTQLKLIGPELLVLCSLHILMINNGWIAAHCSSRQLIFIIAAHFVFGTLFPTLLCSIQDRSTRMGFGHCMGTANNPDSTAEDCTVKQSASKPSCMPPHSEKQLVSDRVSTTGSHPSSMQKACNKTSTMDQSAPEILQLSGTSSGKPSRLDVRGENVVLDGKLAAKPTSSLSDPSVKPSAAHAPSCLYRSKARMRLVSVKVFNHDAYSHRERLSAAVDSHLRSEYSSHPGRLLHLNVASWKGCLQMLLSITEDSNAAGMYPDVLLGRAVLELLASLPDSMDASLCMVHCPADPGLSRITRKGVPAEVPAIESRLGSAHMNRYTVCPLSFNIFPFCVESGHDQPVAMSLVVEAVMAGGQQDLPVDVVTCLQQQGQEVCQKQSLDTFRSDIRLELPANIATGKVAVHIISRYPGQEGALLGSFTTVAVPPPAAQELRQMIAQYGNDPELREGFAELLRDVAVVMCTPAIELHSGCTSDLTEYFSGNNMVHCLALLEPTASTVSAQPTHAVHCEVLPAETGFDQGSPASSSSAILQDGSDEQHTFGPTPLDTAASGANRHRLPVPSLQPKCTLRDTLVGFREKVLEDQYVQYRGDSSTLGLDKASLLFYIMLIVSNWRTGYSFFLVGSAWRIVGDLLCTGVYAAMVSPLRARLAKSRCMLVSGSRALASVVLVLAFYMRWCIPDRAAVQQMTGVYYDMIYCCQFPLVNQVRPGRWLYAAAAAEVMGQAHVFGLGVGLKAAAVRVVSVHILGIAAVVAMDMAARKAFVRHLPIPAAAGKHHKE